MDWTIYSIGDSAFLEQILNAVAMIAGTGDFLSLVRVGFLLGVLALAFQAIVTGRGIEFQQLLLSLIVWFCMFGSSATVRIEDAYTGSVRVVGNVPLGIAAIGTPISNVGYETTRLFEQGFSAPSMTEYGFGAPLNELGLVRGTFSDPASWSAINDPTNSGDDVRLSWYNYVKECTMRGVQLGPPNGLSEDAIWNTNDPVEALRFDSEAYGTRIYLNGVVQDLDCSDAHAELRAFTEGPFAQAAWDLLTQRRAADMAVTGLTAETAVGDALLALGRAGASAQHYMLANVLMPIYEAGIEGRMLADQQFTAAVMTRQSIEQRNAEWAAEFTLFSSFVRPMMTFMEGFVFALGPVMGFLITLGGLGIKVAGKYFLTLLWIQLWMPTAAIVNLFLVMTVERKLEALAPAFADYGDVTSLAGASYLFANISSWLATGGMLASSIPVLTLMLIYGGAVTATAMAGRLSKGDYLDEQMVKPKVAQPAPALMMGSQAGFSATEGLAFASAASMAPMLKVGETMSSVSSSASSQAQTADQTFMRAYGNTLSENRAAVDSLTKGETFMQSLATSASASDQLAYNTAMRVGQEAGLNKEQTWNLAGKLAGGVSGSGGFDLFGNSMKAFGELSGSLGYSEGQRENLRNFFSSDEGKQLARTFQENFSKNLAEDISSGRGTAVTNALGVTDSTSLSQTAGEKLSATEQYSRVASRQSSAESTQAMSVMQFANAIGKEDMGEVRAGLNEAVTRYGLGGRAASLAGTYQRLLGMEQTSAHRAGQIMALEEFAKSGHADSFMAAEDYLDVMHGVTGRAPLMDDADAHAGFRETAAGVWNTGSAAAQAAREGAPGTPPSVGDRIDRSERDLNSSVGDARNRSIANDVEAAVSEQRPVSVDPDEIERHIGDNRGRLSDDPRVLMPLPGKLMDAAQASAQQVADQIEAAAEWTGEMIPHDHPPATPRREQIPEPDVAGALPRLPGAWEK